jgi:flagellar hook-length control protein FliK
MQVPPTSTPATPATSKAGGVPHDAGQADTEFGVVLNKEISSDQARDRRALSKNSDVPREGKLKEDPKADLKADLKGEPHVSQGPEDASSSRPLDRSVVLPVDRERRVFQTPLGGPDVESTALPQSSVTAAEHEDDKPALFATQDAAMTTCPIAALLPTPVESMQEPAVAAALDAGPMIDSVSAPAERFPERTRSAFHRMEDAGKTAGSRRPPDLLVERPIPDSSETERATFEAPLDSLPAPEGNRTAERGMATIVEALRQGPLQPEVIQHVAPSAVEFTRSPSSSSLDSTEAISTIGSERLHPKVGTSAWETALSQRISWMIGDQQHTASLRLEPPDLGVLHVVVTVSQDQATAAFVAAEPEVRRALEAAIPRLREMMDTAGIQLGDATVSAGTSGNENAPPSTRYLPPDGPSDSPLRGPSVTDDRVQTVVISRGLVDTFA